MGILQKITSWPLFRESIGVTMRICYAGLTFLVGIVLARYLGVAEFGAFSFVYAWILLGTSIVQAGTPTLLVREISAYKQKGECNQIFGIIRFSNILTMATSAFVILCIAIAVLFNLFLISDYRLFLLGGPALILLAMSAIKEASTRGLGHVLKGQISELLVRPGIQLLILVLLSFGFFPIGLNKYTAMLSFVFAGAVSLLSASIILRRSAPPGLKGNCEFDFPNWSKSLFKLSASNWVGAVAAAIGVLMVGIMGSDTETAHFRVASQTSMLISIGLAAMNTHQAPALSSAFTKGDRCDLQNLVQRSCAMSLAIAIPLAICFFAMGGPMLTLLYGSEYESAALTLAILTFGQLVNASTGSAGVILVSMRREGAIFYLQLAALTLTITLALLLVPMFGAVGAAAAVTAAHVLWNLTAVILIYKYARIISLPFCVGRNSATKNGLPQAK